MSRSRNTRRGAVVIEAALAMPILVLLTIGTVEICNRIYLQQSISIMAYEGARVAIVPDSTPLDVQMQVEEIGTARNVENVQVSISPADWETRPVGTFIEVTVIADRQSSATVGLFPQHESSATVAMMKEFN